MIIKKDKKMKMVETRQTLEYLWLSLCKSVLYIRLVNSVKDLQKYEDVEPCVQGLNFFDDNGSSFTLRKKCDKFDKHTGCNNKKCLLCELNKKHVDIAHDYENTVVKLEKLRKALTAARIK